MYMLNERFEGFNDISEDLLMSNKIEGKNQRIKDLYFWHYDLDKKDFFLTNAIWYNIKTDAYEITIEGSKCYIPGSYFIIIGEFVAGFDIISPQEIVGRDFSALLFESNLDLSKKVFEDFKITGYKAEHDFIFPLTNNLIPVKVGKKCILVTSKNIYSRLKKLSFTDFI